MATEPRDQTFIRLRSRTDGAWIAPPTLKERLVADAIEQGTNMNDVAVAILADRFQMPFEPSGRKTAPSTNTAEICLKMPGELKLRIGHEVVRSKTKEALLVIAVLAAHYGLPMPAPPQRRRKRRRKPRIARAATA